MSKGRIYQPVVERRKRSSHIKKRKANHRSFRLFWRHDFVGKEPIRQRFGSRQERRRTAKAMYEILVRKRKGHVVRRQPTLKSAPRVPILNGTP